MSKNGSDDCRPEIEELEAAYRRGVEEIIDPRRTRPLLCEWVELAYRIVPTQLGPTAYPLRP